MWKCTECGELIEDPFDACWKCGMSKDGTPSSSFHPEPDDPGIPDPGPAAFPEPLPANRSDSPKGLLTRQEIAELACKILALWLVAKTLPGLVVLPFAAVFVLGSKFDTASADTLITGTLPLAQLALSIFFWTKSSAIARRMLAEDPSPVAGTNIDAQQLMQVAFAAVGVWLLVPNLKDLVEITFILFEARDTSTISEMIWYLVGSSNTWSTLLSLGLSIWLLLGSRGIVRVLRRLQRPE